MSVHDRVQVKRNTFVELDSELGLDEEFFWEVVLMKLRIHNVAQWGWAGEWVVHGSTLVTLEGIRVASHEEVLSKGR